MKFSGLVDMRLPYSTPSVELFTLAAESSSLLVSFSANIDENFDEGSWATEEVVDDNSL